MSWTGVKYDFKHPRMGKISLVAIWAYYCQRCNYVWLPKDFDVDFSKYGKDLLDRQPPKCCARCKSRSWEHLPIGANRDYSQNSLARTRALERVEKQSPDYDPQEDRYVNRLRKQFADNEEEADRQVDKYIIKRFYKKLKKERE